MKSSGQLSLISDQAISDSILVYYSQQYSLKEQSQLQITKMTSYTEFAGNVFDAAIFQKMLQFYPLKVNMPMGNPQLLTNDPLIINQLVGRLHYMNAVVGINTTSAKDRNLSTLRLLHQLQTKYAIE